MRIPSQLHGDPLYRPNTHSGVGRTRSNGTPTPPDQSWRRVVRLVVVLALVLVLMREAGKPAAYEIFFPSTPQKVKQLPSPEDAASKIQNGTRLLGDGEPILAEITKFDELTQPAKQSAAKQWAAKQWAAEQTDTALSIELANWLSGMPLTSTDLQWNQTPSGEIAAAVAMQKELINRIKDGTVWRATDTPGLAATLAMHSASGPRFANLDSLVFRGDVAGVLPLLQQPDFYRGENVVARGDVVRIERIEAPANAFDLDRYWNLWLMPQDASARPWLVIVAELPQEMLGLIEGPTDSQEDQPNSSSANATWSIKTPYPMVNVNGEFIKRLSYQSQAGAELTPIVAGHVESIRSNGNPAILVRQNQSPMNGAASSANAPSAGWMLTPFWTVVAAIGLGVLFSTWVMWRTRTLNRQLRERRQRKPVVLETIAWLIACGSLLGTSVQAQSVMDLLPGFDVSQLQSIATLRDDSRTVPIEDLNSIQWDTRTLAKLAYRFDRLDDAVLKQRQTQTASTTPTNVGDGVSIDGRVLDLLALAVPDDLVDVLEFKTMSAVRIQPTRAPPSIVVFRSLPLDLQIGDRLSGSGALIGNTGTTDIHIGGRLAWNPSNPSSPAASVLSQSGVDLSRLYEIAQLDRKPLTGTDSSVFFAMMGVAKKAGKPAQGEASPSKPLRDAVAAMRSQRLAASPIDLLKTPQEFTGQWIALDIETVRITRVAVESAQRQVEVGSAFYYQVDAIGDLGNVQLKIEVPDGEPVTMENRYPVTVVAAELPEFLQQGQGDDWVSTQTVPIRVEGFFYRLWSYESDFMKARGGKQFAPLVIGGVMEDRRSGASDPIGVSLIGKVAAIGIIAGIIAVIVFGIVTRRGDRSSRKRRYESVE